MVSKTLSSGLKVHTSNWTSLQKRKPLRGSSHVKTLLFLSDQFSTAISHHKLTITTNAGTLDLPYQQFFCASEPHGRGPPANLSRHWTNDAETGLCETDNRVEVDRPRSVNLALRDPHLGTCKFNQSWRNQLINHR